MDTHLPPASPDPPEVIVARPVAHAMHGIDGPRRPAALDLSMISRREARLDLVLVTTVLLLVPVGMSVVFGGLAGMEGPALPPDLSLHRMLTYQKCFDALLAIVILAYLLYRHQLPPTSFGVQLRGWGWQLLWSVPTLIATYAVFLATVVVITVIMMLWHTLEDDVLERTKLLEVLPLDDLWTAVLLLVPVAIHEEVIFRALLIPYLHRLGCGWATAVLLTAAVFGALHVAQGVTGMIQVFFLGLVFGGCFVATRSLLAVIVAHFLFNLLQFQIARYVLPWAEKLAQDVS